MSTITKTIRIENINGVIELLKNVSPKTVAINIEIPDTASKEDTLTRFRSAAGGWKDLLDCDAFIKDVYESRKINTRPEIKL